DFRDFSDLPGEDRSLDEEPPSLPGSPRAGSAAETWAGDEPIGSTDACAVAAAVASTAAPASTPLVLRQLTVNWLGLRCLPGDFLRCARGTGDLLTSMPPTGLADGFGRGSRP